MIKGALLELPLPWTDQLFSHFATILSNDYNDDETYFKRILLGCALNPGRYEVFLFKTILARNPYRKLSLWQRAKRIFFLFVIQNPRFVFLYKMLRKDIPGCRAATRIYCTGTTVYRTIDGVMLSETLVPTPLGVRLSLSKT